MRSRFMLYALGFMALLIVPSIALAQCPEWKDETCDWSSGGNAPEELGCEVFRIGTWTVVVCDGDYDGIDGYMEEYFGDAVDVLDPDDGPGEEWCLIEVGQWQFFCIDIE